MYRRTTIIATVTAILAAGFLLAGCSKSEEGALEKAGKDGDKAVAEAGEKAGEAADDASKALEDIGD